MSNKYCTPPRALVSTCLKCPGRRDSLDGKQDNFVRGLRKGEGWVTWWVGCGVVRVSVGREGGDAGWLAGADEERSHTLVLHVFVLTVSEVPQECTGSPDHTVEVPDESHDINTGKMFSSFEPNKKEETPVGSSPLSLSRPRSVPS